jgi:hypothetical protein
MAALHSSAVIVQHAKCQGVKDVKQARDAAVEAVGDAETVEELYHASGVLAAIGAEGCPGSVLGGAVQKLLLLSESDGTFRNTAKDQEGTLATAALAIRATAWLKGAGAEADWEQVGTKLAGAVAQLAEGIKGEELAHVSQFLQAVAEFSEGVKKVAAFPDESVEAIVASTLAAVHSQSPVAVAQAILALSALANNNYAMPLAVEPISPLLSYSKPSSLQVRVVDVMGRAVSVPCTVQISADNFSPKAFTAAASSVYSFDLLSLKPAPHSYEFDVKAEPKSDDTDYLEVEEEITVDVVGTLEPQQLSLESYIPFSQAPRREGFAVEYPNLSAQPFADLPAEAHLLVSFNVVEGVTKKGLHISQASVRLHSQATGAESIFAAQHQPKKAGFYAADVPIDALVKACNGARGVYDLSVILGDVYVSPAIEWAAASISISGASPAAQKPSARESYFAEKPAIAHQFAEPVRRPGPVIYLTFTGLVLAPIAFLAFYLIAIGFNFNGLVALGAAGFLPAVAFQGCIIAYLLLMAAYFFFLNMIQTLTIAAILAIPTLLTGRFVLSKLSAIDAKPHKE